MIVVADANGVDQRALLFTEYDFEIGDTENSFLVTCLRSEWRRGPLTALYGIRF